MNTSWRPDIDINGGKALQEIAEGQEFPVPDDVTLMTEDELKSTEVDPVFWAAPLGVIFHDIRLPLAT
jgi:hypothetical protein